MTLDFTGRVAVVTGAGGALGRSYAVELARRGAQVVVNDLGSATEGGGRTTSAADDTVAEIRSFGGTATANYDTVATPEGGEAIIAAAVEEFGTVDILINNAGILRSGEFGTFPPEDLAAVLDVHLRGAFHVTQPAFRHMQEKQYGRLLFTSSAAGLFGLSWASGYAAAKAGVVGLAHVLALEGRRFGITANVIAPMAASRMNDSMMIPELEGLLDAELVTPLAAFLVAEQCTLTHEIFSVGGGRFARVFLGLTPGWFAGRDAKPTAEDVAERLGEICSEVDYTVPAATFDDVSMLLQQLGIEPSVFKAR